MGIAEQLSGPFNLSAVEGDSRILMGLFYQRNGWSLLWKETRGKRGGQRKRERVCVCVCVCGCVGLIILTPPSDSTGEVPCQMIQHRLLSRSLCVSLSIHFFLLFSSSSSYICHTQVSVFSRAPWCPSVKEYFTENIFKNTDYKNLKWYPSYTLIYHCTFPF